MADPWILASLIHRDLDDGDQQNALVLAERLFALNNNNDYYRYLYAKCLYATKDYSAVYTVLKDTGSTGSAATSNLFAKSCLELGILEREYDIRCCYWKRGIESVKRALLQVADEVYWREDLTSINVRHNTPTKASLYNLLGDLYTNLDYIAEASKAYLKCLELNPFKLTGYMKLCDIAPDIPDLKNKILPDTVFKAFNIETTDLSTTVGDSISEFISTFTEELSFNDSLDLSPTVQEGKIADYPLLTEKYRPLKLSELRQLIPRISIANEDELNDAFIESRNRSSLEEKKEDMISDLISDINNIEKQKSYEDKFGLYKEPMEQTALRGPHIVFGSVFKASTSRSNRKRTISDVSPPRLHQSGTTKRTKTSTSQINVEDSQAYFAPLRRSNFKETKFTNSQLNSVLEGMNRVLKLIRIIASSYLHRTFYHGLAAAQELQQLDDNQYNSPRILGLIGQTYYDVSDFIRARIFFKHAFAIAPWFYDSIPLYSTTLWYLGYEDELDLLAYCIKDNLCHRFEANIVAGNWEKCLKRNETEAMNWFQKAVKANPASDYAYVLLGLQYARIGDHLNAMRNYKQSLSLNKRSSLVWFSMAMTHVAMQKFTSAKAELMEALRLHPNHPIMLRKMAELLVEEHQYTEALTVINQSLKLARKPETEELKKKILNLLDGQTASIM